MNPIACPLKPQMSGADVDNLHSAIQLLIDRNVIKITDDAERRAIYSGLIRDRAERTYGEVTYTLVRRFQEAKGLEVTGHVDDHTATAFNSALAEHTNVAEPAPAQTAEFEVKGTVRLSDGYPAAGVMVMAYDRDLRHEQPLGQCETDRKGGYRVRYSADQFKKSEKCSADLVVKAVANAVVLAASPTLFNAPASAVIDLTLPDDKCARLSLYEKIDLTVTPLLDCVQVYELEENETHQDLAFLSGETRLDKTALARFALAQKLARQAIRGEFWFALLGGSFFTYSEKDSLEQHLAALTKLFPSLDAKTVRKAVVRALAIEDISQSFRQSVDRWIEEFLQFIAKQTASAATFLKSSLDHAGVSDAKKRETVARLFNEHKAFPARFAAALDKEPSLSKQEVADLKVSAQLGQLTRGDFSVVKMIRTEFAINQPQQIRTLAKKSEDEWVRLVTSKHESGEINLPLQVDSAASPRKIPEAEVYGQMLGRQFREAYPTAAFAGGLERALRSQSAHGLRNAETMKKLFDRHAEFELATTPIDEFLKNNLVDVPAADHAAFGLELKATQRVFKLVPIFEASNALLADNVHSAQQVYRMGKSEFMRRYSDKEGFTKASAETAWNRAAETTGAVTTIVGDLLSHEYESLPYVLKPSSDALSKFPNWNNLFQTGDLCDCEHCRSVLGPAAYFADLLAYLKDRKAANSVDSVKDVLFRRRADLGYLELNCDNALTPLPYIDVVCEALEDVVAPGENDVELAGFGAIPTGAQAAKSAVAAALSGAKVNVGSDFSLTQVKATDPNRWIAHGDEATYLLKKKGTPNFFAEILRNTKASAAELRAYPQYVNWKAHDKLKSANFPITLPFDLSAEEVRASFQKCNLQRWELMRTLRGKGLPNSPTEGDIAAEYFGIGSDPTVASDEKTQILVSAPTNAKQRNAWGESGAGWLATVRNVKSFLAKTRLEYEQLLALINLKFINPDGSIAIRHLNASCDLDQKVIDGLDAPKLDRINRFLRLFRHLDGWSMWELDLVLRHPRIGATSGSPQLDETFLVSLFHFSRLRSRLGKASVEQLCALFGNLNVETRFTALYERRADALYQYLFLNRTLIKPLDEAFALDPATNDLKAGQSFVDPNHQPVVLAALSISTADLGILKGLTKASDGKSYIAATSDLSLANLSFLWRHSWLPKTLRIKIDDWRLLLKILQKDLADFGSPQSLIEFLEAIDGLSATGLSFDELNWVLAADRTSKAAARSPAADADAARFLSVLRTELQAIQASHSASQYDCLTATPPSDIESLTTLLTSLLQELGRDDAGARFFLDTLRDTVQTEAAVDMTIAGWPANFAFPSPITNSIRIRFDKTTSTLRFTGVMTTAQRTTLKSDPSLAAVTGLATYVAAIEELFDKPRLALKFYQPVFTAPLASLPSEVSFSSLADVALAKSISYDSEQRALSFAGFLSLEQKAALNALSADGAYQNAVASLATQPKTIAVPDARIWLSDADLKFPLRDLTTAANDHLAENLATSASKALLYLSNMLSQNAIVRAASGQLALTEAMSRSLLTQYTVLPATLMSHLSGPFAATTGVIDYATLKSTFDAWFWAVRVALIWNKWKVTFGDRSSLANLTVKAKLLDLLTLPLDSTKPLASAVQLSQTARLLRLRDSLPEGKIQLLEVLENQNKGAYAASVDFAADVERLNDAWPANEVQKLADAWSSTALDDFLAPEAWERLRRAFNLMGNLNTGYDLAKTFVPASMSGTEVMTLKGLLRSKFGPETWLTMSGEIQDKLRERKRDALTAYILAFNKPGAPPTNKWENPNDLYAYYLLDVEMCACQMTSRLVQGSGSIQLFVQRCFMGLEPEVTVKVGGDGADSAWPWWTWMSQYRVWEANRKVFLWPENWIEPELRKDNSQFFKEMQNELLQNDINPATVETAFAHYLEKLDNVAQLEIAGFHQEDDGDNTIIHVFGRTTGAEPHVYYYRCYDYVQWTPWEKVELDIQGDYLIPAVLNKRLFLFWPTFTEVQDEQANTSMTTPKADESVKLQRVSKKLRMQMAVSEYRQRQWTPKRISKDFWETPQSYAGEPIKTHLRFFFADRSEIDGKAGICVGGYLLAPDSDYRYQQQMVNTTFELNGCHGVPELGVSLGNYAPIMRPEVAAVDSDPMFSKWQESPARTDAPDSDFTIENPEAALFNLPNIIRSSPILLQTSPVFKATPAWHLSRMDKMTMDGLQALSAFRDPVTNLAAGSWLPFFYNDKKRTFFVRPALYNQGSAKATEVNGVTVVSGETWSYYPLIKKFFDQMESNAEGQAKTWTKDFKFSALTAAEQQQYVTFFVKEFPEEMPPQPQAPFYTDEQAVRLLTRFIMRYFHFYIGFLSAFFFQFRQYNFKTFYHPFVCEFGKLVYNPLKGLPALMSRETQLKDSGFSFKQTHQPTIFVVDPLSEESYPKEDVDFSPDGAYSPYNWELFFHAPLMIANALSRNQRFSEARDWYHFIFNPIGVESAAPGGSVMSKYWITKPFYQTTDDQYVQQRIENIIGMLAGDTSVPGYTADLKTALEGQVLDWRNHPFEPHRIANYRTVAYQKTVVMKYLDNLLAWGDSLFAQDTMESVNQATQIYVLAAEILGPRPMKVPPQARPPIECFNELEDHLDNFSNALIQVENLVPIPPGKAPSGPDPAPIPTLYFCVPHNEKMLGYWATVADRLYKIRHCMNIEGVERQLALFAPPIDPGALVKAVAGGMDLSSALADLAAPLPFYRFNVLLQKANEVCVDVKALGAALLGALEKKDAEALALLRQEQELRVLSAVKTLREMQLEEAKQNLTAVQRSKAVTEEKRNYYRDIQRLNDQERSYLDRMDDAHAYSELAQGIKLGASVVSLLPEINLGASGFGGTPHATFKIGGLELGQAAGLAADVLSLLSQIASDDASTASAKGSYDRRWDDWKLQERLANKELEQIDQQITAAQQRINIAQQELDNQQLQIDNSKAVDAFMRLKYTNKELYEWQVGQISSVYFQSYKLAYDLAKRAERCFRFELGLQDSSYINFGYWDSLKKGLLSGEQLQYDLRRLESAYVSQNRREYELTKHVSLAQLDPIALVKLRETGRCFVRLPEEIFDLDFSGHYFRRIKSVSLTLPCIVGPYTTPGCTIRLLKNSMRINTANGDNGYVRNTDDQGLPTDDDRFIESNVPFKAIAASSGQNDSGVFELSFRDERYLPFEGAGVISEWSIELFNDLPANNPDPAHPDFGRPLRQFDYASVSDVVFQIKYSAREEAGAFKNGVISNLRSYFGPLAFPMSSSRSMRCLDLRREFATQWERFLKPSNPAQGNVFEFMLKPELFLTRDVGKVLKINTLWLLARCTDLGGYDVAITPPAPAAFPDGTTKLTLAPLDDFGGLHVQQKSVSALDLKIDPAAPPVTWRLKVTRPGGGNLQSAQSKTGMEVEEIFLVLEYEWES